MDNRWNCSAIYLMEFIYRLRGWKDGTFFRCRCTSGIYRFSDYSIFNIHILWRDYFNLDTVSGDAL